MAINKESVQPSCLNCRYQYEPSCPDEPIVEDGPGGTFNIRCQGHVLGGGDGADYDQITRNDQEVGRSFGARPSGRRHVYLHGVPQSTHPQYVPAETGARRGQSI